MSAAAAANPFADDAQSGSTIDHSGNPFADDSSTSTQTPPEKPGIWQTIKNDAAGVVDSITNPSGAGVSSPYPGVTPEVAQATWDQAKNSAQSEKDASYGPGYRLAAGVAQGVGVNVPGMEKDAKEGNARGVVGHALFGAGTAAAPLVAEGALRGGAAAVDAVRDTASSAREAKIAAPIKATVPEAAMQPDKAVAATDRLVRAAAPTATDVRARANFHAAAGDLAQVTDKVDWDATRGGKALTAGGAAPDMRPRAVLNAINERMGEMYQQEVEPKIQAMQGVPAKLDANPDAYRFLATTAGDETTRALAQKAAEHPETITVPEAYQLSRAVNAELVKFESLPADQQYLARTTNPAINKLDGLDESLNNTISRSLKDRGIGGIDKFNRRYAAMASVRRGLSMRVNAAELQREGTLSRAGKVVRAVTGKNVNAIASASQASLADVNIGDQLERGLKDLKKSGVKPDIDSAPPAPSLTLKSPEGKLPPDTQRPLSFMDTPSPDRSGPVFPGGKGNLGKALTAETSASSSAKPTEPASGTAEKTSGTSSSGGQIVQGEPDRFLKLMGADEGSVVKTPQDEATVQHFQEKIRNGQSFEDPTLTVDKNKNIISGDGRHRLVAHQREGTPSVSVRVNRTGEEGVKPGVIGQRLAKPRTPNAPLEHGFDFRPAEDLGNAAREASQKKQGPIARGERRAIPRTPEEQRTQQLFAESRKELGDDATSDEIMARVEQKKGQTAKPGMMRALSKKKGA